MRRSLYGAHGEGPSHMSQSTPGGISAGFSAGILVKPRPSGKARLAAARGADRDVLKLADLAVANQFDGEAEHRARALLRAQLKRDAITLHRLAYRLSTPPPSEREASGRRYAFRGGPLLSRSECASVRRERCLRRRYRAAPAARENRCTLRSSCRRCGHPPALWRSGGTPRARRTRRPRHVVLGQPRPHVAGALRSDADRAEGDPIARRHNACAQHMTAERSSGNPSTRV